MHQASWRLESCHCCCALHLGSCLPCLTLAGWCSWLRHSALVQAQLLLMQRLTARLDGQQPGRDGHLASSSADADQDTLQLWNEVMPFRRFWLPFSSIWFPFSFCSLLTCSLLLPSTSQIWACALLASKIVSSMAIVRVSTDSLQQQRDPM